MKQRLTFCSVILPGQALEKNSLTLAESIRAFGGRLSANPIWFFLPDDGRRLTDGAQQRLHELEVSLIPLNMDREGSKFFFMPQLAGLAQVEKISQGETEILAWMDSNTILLAEPADFNLPAEKSLAYCPVHHLLLGSRFDQPLDPFWTQIYQRCQVQPERVFPMRPVIEDLQMRPYFNAGLLVARPERGLFARWYATFKSLYQLPEFQAFYEQDPRYAIFMHQAVLAGVVLGYLEHTELCELPHGYNYPLHLHEQHQPGLRPASLDELVTLRHENFSQDASKAQKIPSSERLVNWLAERA